jgi:diaminopimelate epimerase
MVYFNANGYEGSMCGNGGRCAVHFARGLGIVNTETSFSAVDGLHEAKIEGDLVELKMSAVNSVEVLGEAYFIDTGSPHHIEFVNDLTATDSYQLGKDIRYNERYAQKGANVNFVEKIDERTCKVSTYERGVEDLTLSCGTGVTAVAIAILEEQNAATGEYKILTKNRGGELSVRLEKQAVGTYKDIWLLGPAARSFTGELELREG